MPSRDSAIYSRPLMHRFLPADGPALPGFLPALRAFSGIVVGELRKERARQPLGRLGSLEARLARNAAEVRRAQRLRYRVFYKEGAAMAEPAQVIAQRDMDAFDGFCDHLLVVDRAIAADMLPFPAPVVGTYRLLRQEVAERHDGFYTAGEFDIGGLIARHPHLRFLELGRSCVLPPYRNKRTVELLWQGIWAYVQHHGRDVMIGCASLEGTDPERLALPLSFLHHYAPAPEAWRAGARPERRVEMNRMAKDAIDAKAALRALPPLIKGYLRLGAYIGDGAVIDYQFGTTDVLIILPVSALTARYVDYFSPAIEARAA
jgi:L-ornithine Nalpha-acyltransferase